MKRTLVAGALLLSMLGAGACQVPGWEDGICQEDEPCWDCGVMGNLDCGPTNDERDFNRCMSEWGADPKGLEFTEAVAECQAEADYRP